jgi:hypothetical protein
MFLKHTIFSYTLDQVHCKENAFVQRASVQNISSDLFRNDFCETLLHIFFKVKCSLHSAPHTIHLLTLITTVVSGKRAHLFKVSLFIS